MHQTITKPQEGALLTGTYGGSIQRFLFTRYGDPRIKGWGNKWMLMWKVQQTFGWFPEARICVHKDFQPGLYKAFSELEYLGLHEEIKTCDEAFGIRLITGSDSVLSVHSWGMALDLNAEDNPLGSDGNWSEDFIDIMRRNGIYCGQNWTGRKDPMHFSFANG